MTIDNDIHEEPTRCIFCDNLLDYAKKTCKAFQDGIPQDILTGEFDHTKKHPAQDNDILFEPIKKNE